MMGNDNMMETKKASPEDDYMSRVKAGLKYVESGDLDAMKADITVEAEDGEKVALLVTGIAQGGKIMNPIGTMIDIGGGSEKQSRLKQMLSDEDANEEE